MKIAQEILEEIKALPTPSLIAISGFGGAGKSTLAEQLSGVLDAPVIGIDTFNKDRTRSDYTHWNSMDFERFEKEVLIPFSMGQSPIRYGHYDWGANDIVKTVEIPHESRLIVEGVGLFRPELLKYFSYKIWVDCPQDEANARGKKRDREVHKNPQDENWDGVWKRNDEEYFVDFKPKELADAIIINC